jgi:hypothetical protein
VGSNPAARLIHRAVVPAVQRSHSAICAIPFNSCAIEPRWGIATTTIAPYATLAMLLNLGSYLIELSGDPRSARSLCSGYSNCFPTSERAVSHALRGNERRLAVPPESPLDVYGFKKPSSILNFSEIRLNNQSPDARIRVARRKGWL